MLMPKATVNLDNFSAGTENEVGFAGKVLVMEAETITKAMEESSHFKLRLHAFASDAPHVLASLLRRELVHQSNFCIANRKRRAVRPARRAGLESEARLYSISRW